MIGTSQGVPGNKERPLVSLASRPATGRSVSLPNSESKVVVFLLPPSPPPTPAAPPLPSLPFNVAAAEEEEMETGRLVSFTCARSSSRSLARSSARPSNRTPPIPTELGVCRVPT